MQITFDLITTRKEIYSALRESEDNQSIVGISSPDLGPGMYLTTVKELIDDAKGVFVILNSYDSTGYFLEKNRILLDNVRGVLPFKTVFTNPFLKQLESGPLESKVEPDYLL